MILSFAWALPIINIIFTWQMEWVHLDERSCMIHNSFIIHFQLIHSSFRTHFQLTFNWFTVNVATLALVIRARACKGADQKWSSGVKFHVSGSVGDCEGMNRHTPKWTLTLGHYTKMRPSSLLVSLDFEWIWTFLPSEID